MENNFIFVIDTDQYAGNFEREICAFCTGRYGECEVGKKIADEFRSMFPKEWDSFEIVNCYVMDDHGTGRPAAIIATPPDLEKCNSVAIFFDEKPTHEQINFICQRATDYCAKKNIKILKFRLIQEVKTEKEIWTSGT